MDAPESLPEDAGQPDVFARFAAAPPRAKVKALLVAAFIALHVTVTLIWGAGDAVKEHFKPVFGFYGSGLKLAGTWGMFATPAKMSVNFVYGVDADRTRVPLSPPRESSLLESLIDMRERKFRSRLGEQNQRDHWGGAFLESFCRKKDGSWFQRIELEAAEHDQHHRWGTRKVVFNKTCFYARSEAMKAERAKAPASHGGSK